MPVPTMDHQQYRAALAALGLSQVDAARLLGVNARTSRHWALGERGVPPPVAILLRVWQLRPEVLTLVRDMLEIPNA